jgi:hypothetical protein
MRLLRTFVVVSASVALLITSMPLPATAAPPTNDLRTNATVVSALPYTHSSTTIEASHSADEPTDCMSSSNIWYQYTPKRTQVVKADTEGSNFDTKLAIYTDSGTSLSLVDCDDDDGTGTLSRIGVELQAGTTYYFMVGGWEGAAGSTVFNLAAAKLPVVVPKFTGTANPDGTATVRLALSCRQGAVGEVDWFFVSQATGAESGIQVSVLCGESTTVMLSSWTDVNFSVGSASVLWEGSFTGGDFTGDPHHMEGVTSMKLSKAR